MKLTTEQLTMFKEKLESLQNTLESEIHRLKLEDPFSDTTRTMDNAATDTDAREEMGHIENVTKKESLEKRLSDVLVALEKIDKGTYGISEKTGEPILLERLEAMPDVRWNIGE
jgi:DnaK suppressor protein